MFGSPAARRSHRRVLVLTLCLLGCGPRPAHRASATETAQQSPSEDEFELHEGLLPSVYRGENGLLLEVVYLAEVESLSTALVRFKGIDHPLAGKVFLATRSGPETERRWQVRYDGGKQTLVGVQASERTGVATVDVYLFIPRLNMSFPVSYDQEASAALSPAKMIADHKRHKSSGELDRLAAVDRKYHIDVVDRAWSAARTKVEQACRAKVPAEILWRTYPDEEVGKLNPCPASLATIAKICNRDLASRRTVLKSIRSLTCSYAKEAKRSLDEGALQLLHPTGKSLNVKANYQEFSALLALTDTVVQDEQGRIAIFSPELDRPGKVYLGDGKTMRRVASTHHGSSRSTWGTIQSASFRKTDTGWVTRCPDRDIQFSPVDDATRLDILKNAVFIEEPLWRHREYALARDDRGNYYYVDHDAEEFGGQNFRVFRGLRGLVREVPLTDIVDDSDGKIFATKAGKLRLVLGDPEQADGEATWIEGNSRTKLVRLPLQGNQALIYTGLGVYDGESFGTLCDY